MIAILEELKKGSTEIRPIYKSCVEMWSEVLDDAQDLSVEDLAERISLDLQRRMEHACGKQNLRKKNLGKTIMAFSGFHYLCDEHGIGNNSQLAERLLQAFDHSGVSSEVKARAKRAAGLF